MTVNNEFQELFNHLKMFDQQHLLSFWDELSESEKELLKKDIKEIDFPKYFNDLKEAKHKSAMNKKLKVDDQLEPPSSNQCGSWLESTPEQLEKYNNIGLDYLSNGEYCAVLMAGGVGTRLGVKYPKGMYNVGLPSGKSLFQIQAERLLRLENLTMKHCGRMTPIMWYVMTSDCTRDATVNFFQKYNYFGLKHDQVCFFEQLTLPVIGCNGKILLESKFKISKSPDGNGGLYRAMRNYKLIEDMKSRGIKYAQVYGVDNILIKIADPVFLGFCSEQQAECAAKVVEKVDPHEAVGIVGKVNGRFQVVEYSEISLETATMLDSNGDKLKYRSGSICNHLFHIDFLERICHSEVTDSMVQHIALKKVAYVDTETGLLKVPEKENAIKMERFIFDIFPFATTFAIWEVDRSREFSPLKNAPGSQADCPETAKKDLLSYHSQLALENVSDANLKEKLKSMIIEISPLISYSGEDLKNISHTIKKFAKRVILHLEKTSKE